jgi:hypothetical protein
MELFGDTASQKIERNQKNKPIWKAESPMDFEWGSSTLREEFASRLLAQRYLF